MITKERFAEGLTLPEYLDQMRMNRERFLRAFDAATIEPESGPGKIGAGHVDFLP